MGADAADIALLTEGVALPVVLLLAAITTASIARVSGAVPVTRVLIPFAVWAYLVFYAVEHGVLASSWIVFSHIWSASVSSRHLPPWGATLIITSVGACIGGMHSAQQCGRPLLRAFNLTLVAISGLGAVAVFAAVMYSLFVGEVRLSQERADVLAFPSGNKHPAFAGDAESRQAKPGPPPSADAWRNGH